MNELLNMWNVKLGQQMRDEYLSFQKYLLRKTPFQVSIYPLIYLYRAHLNKYGAYGINLDNILKKIYILDKDTSKFCRAEILFLQGKFLQSITILNDLKVNYKQKTDVYYLIYKNYIMLNETFKAQNTLYESLLYSKRKKTWLYLSNSIENTKQFERFEKIFFDSINIESEKNIQIFNYYSEAALRAEQYSKALNIWIQFVKNIKKSKCYLKKKKKHFNSKKAEKALLDLKSMLDKNQVPFFLVSGTLLGCIREGKILPHDKDLDIGIFNEDFCGEKLKNTITQSGFFEILPTRIPEQIKIKHNNGTYIDVFIHIRKDNYIWHYASKIKWFNYSFKLKEYNFLNTSFFVPSNTEKYLNENYGTDWKVPKIDFDSNFDTPNAKVSNIKEMQIFYVRMLAYKYLNNDIESPSFERLIKNLSNEVVICLKKESILVK